MVRVDEEIYAYRESCRTLYRFSIAQSGQQLATRFATLTLRLIWTWIAVLAASPALANGDTITGAELRAHRPEDFYIQIYTRDETVCGPIPASLNEPYTRRQGPREEQMVLMGPRHLIDGWREKRVNWIDAKGEPLVWRMSQLIVDIDNDGQNDALYRWTGSLSSTIFDEVVVSLAPSQDELSDATLSHEAFKEILGSVPEGDIAPTGFLKLSRKTIDVSEADLPSHGLYWFEALSIGIRNYLIASDAVHWRSTAVTSVLEFQTTRSLRLICQFRGAIDIVR